MVQPNDYDRETLEWYVSQADALGTQIAGMCKRALLAEERFGKRGSGGTSPEKKNAVSETK